jgi:predicted GNAT family N-acyltransferase
MRDLFISSYTQALSSRTAILQTLNRVINGVYFSLDPFAQTVDAWEGMPIIFSQEHPDMKALMADPEAELARIGGREVGKVANPRIELVGHPRLMADTQIYDPVVNDLIDQGQVSLSTGFYAADDNYKITGNVTPNHLLVFKESLFDQPRDLGSGFLNKNSSDTYILEIRRSKKMADIPETKPPETLTAEQIAKLDKIDVEQFLNMQRQLKDKLDQSDAVIQEQYQRIKDQEAKLTAFAQMEKDQKWKNLERKLPKGLVTGAESLKTREWLNKDPEGLMAHVIDILESHTKELVTEQGKQFLQNIRNQQTQEADSLCAGIFIHGDEK